MLESSTPTKFVMSVVIFSNPSFATLGIAFAYIFLIFQEIYTFKILFIHNVFYMIFIAILAMPITLLSIRVVKSQYWLIFTMFSLYTVLFGILIPLLLI